MKITIYVDPTDLEKLFSFLKEKGELEIVWSEQPYANYIEVILTYEEFKLLKKSSDKVSNNVEEIVEIVEDINFWNLPDEDLIEFNGKGLFNYDQLQQSFLAGCEYIINMRLQESGEVYKNLENFKNWFDKKINVGSKAV